MSTSSKACLATAGLMLLSVVGCGRTTGPSITSKPCPEASPVPSTWPANVTGCWIQPSIDTWTELRLTQRGSTVSGAYVACGVVGGLGCNTLSQVSGSVAFPSVVLHWTAQGVVYRFSATMSATADTLAGTVAANAGAPQPTWPPFHRVSAQ